MNGHDFESTWSIVQELDLSTFAFFDTRRVVLLVLEYNTIYIGLTSVV
jgi:hypothetical protein